MPCDKLHVIVDVFATLLLQHREPFDDFNFFDVIDVRSGCGRSSTLPAITITDLSFVACQLGIKVVGLQADEATHDQLLSLVDSELR